MFKLIWRRGSGLAKRLRISTVWIVPGVAALAAGGVVVHNLLNEGPTITLLFSSAQGIEPNKTFVKYKDVRIGQVTAVQLAPEGEGVEVTTKIMKSAAGLMVKDSQFWVVRPRLGLSEVSGLNTLLSGNYIAFAAGRSGEKRARFTGLDSPPVGAEGREFVLRARSGSGLASGAPVYFRRVQVGQVITSDLAADGRSVDVKVFVKQPYDRFVAPDARFWGAAGLNVSLGASGVDIHTASLAELISGGVEFDAPQIGGGREPAAAGTTFALYRDEAEARKEGARQPGERYVLHFDESLRGLSVGAPVTFLGLAAGEVTDVGLDYDPVRDAVRPRVEITLFGDRVLERLPSTQVGSLKGRRGSATFHRMVEERGLRAQLRSLALIGGQQYVALERFPRAGRTRVDWSRAVPELPSTPSPLPDLESKVAAVLEKLDRLPLDAIATDLRGTLSSLDGALSRTSALASNVDSQLVPRLAASLDKASRLISGVDDRFVASDAAVQRELATTLQEVTRAARALRTLADSIERHPESLVYGRATEK